MRQILCGQYANAIGLLGIDNRGCPRLHTSAHAWDSVSAIGEENSLLFGS